MWPDGGEPDWADVVVVVVCSFLSGRAFSSLLLLLLLLFLTSHDSRASFGVDDYDCICRKSRVKTLMNRLLQSVSKQQDHQFLHTIHYSVFAQ
jgi:hypothetical protein